MTENHILLIIDVQEKLAPAIEKPEVCLASIVQLVKGASILNIPIIISEHCAEKIGPTVSQIIDSCAFKPTIFPKTSFSCFSNFEKNFGKQMSEKPIVAIAGMETHVCVYQSTLDFVKAGYECMLVVDATASQKSIDHKTALTSMQSIGATLTTCETLLFYWMRTAQHPKFKEILRLIKDSRSQSMTV